MNFTFIELTVAKVSFVKLGTFSVNVGRFTSIQQKFRFLIENPLAGKAGQRNSAKGMFSGLTSIPLIA